MSYGALEVSTHVEGELSFQVDAQLMSPGSAKAADFVAVDRDATMNLNEAEAGQALDDKAKRAMYSERTSKRLDHGAVAHRPSHDDVVPTHDLGERAATNRNAPSVESAD